MLFWTLRFLALDVLLLMLMQAHGCTGGKVFDEKGTPMLGVKAICRDLPVIGPVFSDGTGMYKWPDGAVPEGTHTFVIEKDGYEAVTLSADVKYAPAPGHTAAEGLIFQLPDIRLQRVGSRPPATTAVTVPPATVVTRATQPPLPPSTAPPPRIVESPTGGGAGTVPFPTFPPASLRPPPPPTAAVTTTQVTAPVFATSSTSPTIRVEGGRTTTSSMRFTTTTEAVALALGAPGQQWYPSPDQKYSLSAPPEWRVGFQGNQATLEYVEGNCTAARMVVQVNNPGRPNLPVTQESSMVISGSTAQVRTYQDKSTAYFFSCGEDRYTVFKTRMESCAVGDPNRLEQSILLILTSLHCN